MIRRVRQTQSQGCETESEHSFNVQGHYQKHHSNKKAL